MDALNNLKAAVTNLQVAVDQAKAKIDELKNQNGGGIPAAEIQAVADQINGLSESLSQVAQA